MVQAEASAANARNAVRAAQARVDQADAALRAAQASAKALSAQTVRHAAQTQQAETAVAQARSSHAALQSAVEVERAKADQAVASGQQAASNFAALQAQVHGHQAKLEQAGAAVEQARQAYAALLAEINGQRAKVGQAQAQLLAAGSGPEQIGVSQAQYRALTEQVLGAQAKVAELQLQLTYTKVLAPHDGVVTGRLALAGQVVPAGQALLSVADLGSAHITANFKETQLDEMRVGSRATFTVDAYPRRRFTGHVTSLSPGTGAVFSLLPPENATGNFTKVVQRVPVRIAVDSGEDAGHRLRLGMSVIASVSVGAPHGQPSGR